MARARGSDLVIVVVALAVAALATVGIFALGSRGSADLSPVSRGEAIFQSGVDADGDLIPRSSSGGGMMGEGGMMGGGCATCHGTDGRGRTTAAFTAPNITYDNLTDPRGMLEPDGGRGPTFSDATLRTAVIEGLDPEGSRLEARRCRSGS
ncbi:MAG TPA: hypothetical protein VFZ86_12260 [Thermoleophilia bacterium]|nr:hypothetical protein [Thermoleophilia bacterium]